MTISNRTLPAMLTVAILGVLFVIASQFSYLDHNDQYYVSAAYALGEYGLYRDFALTQTPYHLFVLALFQWMFPHEWPMLASTVATLFFGIVSAALFYGLARRITGPGMALFALFVFGASPVFTTLFFEASNYTPAMAAGLGGAFCFFWMLDVFDRGGGRWQAFACGALLAVATGLKIYYLALLPVPFLAGAVLLRRHAFRTVLMRLGLPVGLGIVAGFLPLIAYTVMDPVMMWETNFGTIDYTAAWRVAVGEADVAGITRKAAFAADYFGTSSLQSLALLIIVFAVVSRFAGTRLPEAAVRTIDPAIPAFIVFAAVLSFIITFIAKPQFPQYMAFPFPFWLLGGFLVMPERVDRRWAVVLMVVLSIGLLYDGGHWVYRKTFKRPDVSWKPVRIHEISNNIRDAAPGENPLAATVSPLYAVESGMRVYPELITGPFVYRMMPHVPEEKRKYFLSVAPDGIDALLDARPPDVIIIGTERHGLEDPFIAYAETNSYRKADGDFGPLTVYVRPD